MARLRAAWVVFAAAFHYRLPASAFAGSKATAAFISASMPALVNGADGKDFLEAQLGEFRGRVLARRCPPC